MRIKLWSIILPLLLLAAPVCAKADSLQISYHPDVNTYYYELILTQYPAHYSGDFLKVTGFSGLTEVDLNLGLSQFNFASLAWTPTSVTVSSPSLYVSSQDYAYGIFSIKSDSVTMGLVDYTLVDSAGTFTGKVAGPVASSPVPEPSSLLLLSSGTLGALGLIRRRIIT